MINEVNHMYDPNDLSTETISDLFFEQTKRMTWKTLRDQRMAAISSRIVMLEV